MSVSEWCKLNEISKNKYHYWNTKINKKQQLDNEMEFAEFTSIISNTPRSGTNQSKPADYILHARGHSDLPFVILKENYCNTKMTSSLFCLRLEKYMDLAGIKRSPKDKLGMHTFRRSLGTELMESGSSLELVSQILGHDSTSATQLYISYSEELLAVTG